MSIINLVRKAKRISKDNFIQKKGFSRGIYYYTIRFSNKEDIDISIGGEEETKLIGCTCKFHSVKDPTCKALCSYFIACLFKLKEDVK